MRKYLTGGAAAVIVTAGLFTFASTTVFAHSGDISSYNTCQGWGVRVDLNNNVTSDRTVDVITTIPGTTGIHGGHYNTTTKSGDVVIWDSAGTGEVSGSVTLDIWNGESLEFTASVTLTAGSCETPAPSPTTTPEPTPTPTPSPTTTPSPAPTSTPVPIPVSPSVSVPVTGAA
jgi:hypothetical protein